MTGTNTKKSKLREICVVAVLAFIELAMAAIPTAAVAAISIPIAVAERGYMALGGEWIITAAVFCISYSKAHNKVCDWVWEEEQSIEI